MLKSAGIVLISQVVMMGVLFLRNVFIAWLVSVEDFGVAINFSIVFAFLENATYVGLQRMIVQDRDGDSEHFQAALHLLHVLRGVIGAGLGLLLAFPYAHFIGASDLTWAFCVLASLPLIRSFQHLDVFRYQRHMRFRDEALINMFSPILSLVTALLVYFVSADYQMMLWAIIAQQVVVVVMSHLLAERPFQLVWDGPIIRRALKFGIPLLFNGLLFFAFTNGERIIISNQFGLEVLGWFSAGFMLVQALANLVNRTMGALMLPKISSQPDNAVMQAAALQLGLVLGLGLLLACVLFGPPFLLLTFGERYAAVLHVLSLLALAQMLLIYKSAVTIVAMALGDTLNALYSNMPRIVSLPVAFWVVEAGHGLTALLYVGLAGEVVGIAVAMFFLNRKHKVSMWPISGALAAFCAVGGWVVVMDAYMPSDYDPMQWEYAVLVLLACGAIAMSHDLLRYGRGWYQNRRPPPAA